MNTPFKKKVQEFARFYAVWLSSKTEQLSAGSKKIALVLFCLLFGGISLYLVVIHMTSSSFYTHAPFIQRIILPKNIDKANNYRISKKLYQRIEALKNDDSLMKARPQLLDSIQLFEQIYQSQIKK